MTTTAKTIDESPKISDTILFELETTNSDGDKINPYKVDRIIIYYLARNFGEAKPYQITSELADGTTAVSYFNRAQVIKTFGDDENPAWLSTDVNNAFIERVDTGKFELNWTPSFAREGDYIICWTWTPIIAGTKLAQYTPFYLQSDTRLTTSIPTHFTKEDKYETLLTRYLPEFAQMQVCEGDLTPQVLGNFNSVLAKAFTQLEDMANQLPDLLDANSIHEQLLIYLANMFNLILRSEDSTLWRRQIKRAIPIFKRKGTLLGLREALSQAGINLESIEQLWQVVSPYTWQEAFTVTGDQQEFELSQNVYDGSDYELYLRKKGETTYENLNPTKYAHIDYDIDDAVYLLKWKGDKVNPPIDLEDGDIIKIVYKRKHVDDAALESHLRTLPLADQRDEAEVSYPPKNWNVRLIEESDAYFNALCPTKHPFIDQLVYGKIRTEFPYSEAIYNMEEYNGSIRDSNDPCHLDKAFVDPCGCCLSSNFNINVVIENISSGRIEEAEQIVNEYKPFDAIIHSMNVKGGVNEVMPPQQESVNFYIRYKANDSLVLGQNLFTRTMEDGDTTAAIRRNVLANASVVASSTGTGTNSKIVLYSPGINFNVGSLGLDVTNNYLEILSGPDIGEYKVASPDLSIVDITQGVPDTISFPLNENGFPFRLSNVIFSGSVTGIAQDDVFRFFDPTVSLRHLGVDAGWKINVTAPAGIAGTYDILNTLPDDVLILQSWPDTENRGDITYQLLNEDDEEVGEESSRGEFEIIRRARVDGGTDFIDQYQIKQGYYLQVGSSQYLITQIVDEDHIYISDWTSGNMGTTAAKVYRRLIDNTVGYLDVKGMSLTTATNYESSLSISNGTNGTATIEDDQFKENFLVLIDGQYYLISEIDGTTITLDGPKLQWGLSGQSVDFDIIKFEKQSTTIGGHTINFIDRRNGDYVRTSEAVSTPVGMMANILNTSEHEPIKYQIQQESINIGIEWK